MLISPKTQGCTHCLQLAQVVYNSTCLEKSGYSLLIMHAWAASCHNNVAGQWNTFWSDTQIFTSSVKAGILVDYVNTLGS